MIDNPAPQPNLGDTRISPSDRRFGWSNMFVKPEEDPRSEGGFQGEKATLVGYLRDSG